MTKHILEYEIKKFNPLFIKIIEPRAVNENAISEDYLSQLTEIELTQLYAKLKLGKLIYEVGFETIENIVNQIKIK